MRRTRRSDSSGAGRPAAVWWTLIALLVIEIGVRFVVKVDARTILIVETVSFLVVAAVFLGLLRRPGMSKRRRLVFRASAVVFLLAALRSGLWAGGVAVHRANLIILAIGLITVAVFGWRRRMSR